MDEVLREFESSRDPEIADELLELLMAAKRAKWEKSTSEMNFKHSSRKTWNLMRKLGEAANSVKINVNINPEKIASKIKQNSTKAKGDKVIHRRIKSELRKIKSSL